MRETKKRTRKTKNRTLAIPAAATDIPPNPSRAATMAMTRKINVQRNIGASFASWNREAKSRLTHVFTLGIRFEPSRPPRILKTKIHDFREISPDGEASRIAVKNRVMPPLHREETFGRRRPSHSREARELHALRSHAFYVINVIQRDETFLL
jgi:hypothetical protein